MKQISYEPAIKKLQQQADKQQERVDYYTKKEEEAAFYKKQMQEQLNFTMGQIRRLQNPQPTITQDHTVLTEHELAGK